MTIRAWRIVEARRAEQAFDGEGARLFGGRWNHVGTAVVYTASARSLAMLELLAHANPQYLAKPFMVIPVDFDEDQVELVGGYTLPDGWNAHPARNVTKDMGSRWAASKRSLALAVPSALVPQERNYLLNPRHPEFADVAIGAAEHLHIDERFRIGV